MKAMIIFSIYVAFQLTICLNGIRADENVEYLDKLARKGKTIDGILKPLENGFLGSGSFGLTYRGQFVPRNNLDVAIKFSPPGRVRNAKREYEIYTYLGAVDNPSSEAHGIPSMYYFGWNNNYTMLAITLLDLTFQQTVKNHEMTQADVLVAFREFVRVIKYIHSKGIIHDGIAINNMLIQNGRGFIFDFGSSLDMNDYNPERRIQLAKNDFRRFILSMYALVSPSSNWEWLGLSAGKESDFRMRSRQNFIDKLLEDVQSGNEFTGIRKIFVEVAKQAFDNESTSSNGVPFYDHLYQIITEECDKHANVPKSSISSISSIPDPFSINEWPRPKIDYRLFETTYAEQIQAARAKGWKCSCFKA